MCHQTSVLLLPALSVSSGRQSSILESAKGHSYEVEEDDAGEESEDTSMVYLNYALKVKSR